MFRVHRVLALAVMSCKIVVCGAGFIGTHIARALVQPGLHPLRHVQISSRTPERVHKELQSSVPDSTLLLSSVSADITKLDTLERAFKDADYVVSLVGVMHGSPSAFEDIQWKGAENVARAAKASGSKLIHFSAIGADATSDIPYARTKAMAEKSVLQILPDTTILRPSIVFGPGDGFFVRFAKLSSFLPFMPVFGGGHSRFQPVCVYDLARAVEIISRNDPEVNRKFNGKIIECGGPEVFSYRQIMELVLRYTNRRRPILSLPWAVGMVQGAILEQLPENLFTLSRAQVKQLQSDNVVNTANSTSPDSAFASFEELLAVDGFKPTSVHDVLPKYL